MIILRQSRYDVLLLIIVAVLSVAANLPEAYALVDKRALIVILAVIVAVALVRYVRVSLVLVTAVLVLGANVPADMAVRLGIEQNVLLLTLCLMVVLALANHYTGKIPSGEEPEHRAQSAHRARALFNAVIEGRSDVVQSLVRSGVNVNVRTLTGKTPLMAASFKGHAEITQLLLNAGARPDARDAEGNTALSIARHQGHSRIVAYLKMAGADDQPQYLDVAGLTRSPD